MTETSGHRERRPTVGNALMEGQASGDPFGCRWQLEPATFVRWVIAEGVFGPMSSPSKTSARRHGEAQATEPGSATLGWLYLEQGHLEDAEEIFRLVLDRQPGDARARDGQREVARRRRAARRVARLNRFLDRVRDPGD